MATVATMLLFIAGYGSGLFAVPFWMALSSVRIVKEVGVVTMTAIDAMAMAKAGIVLVAVPPLLATWGLGLASIGAVIVLLAWFGFRLRIRVTRNGTFVVRTVLFVIPWRQRSYPGTPYVFSDGWGDELDPEALSVELVRGGPYIELGWGSSKTGRSSEDLAREARTAIAAL